MFMTENEIIGAIIGPNQQGRCKNTIGFFVEEWFNDGSEKLRDELYVQKPIVEISEFSDETGQEYYCFDFVYKSKKDADLRQQWRFLENFVSQSLQNADKNDSEIVLIVSVIPIAFEGKYSLFAKRGLPESIVCVERATDRTCTIKVIFAKNEVCILTHDEDLLDKHQIEREVDMEIEAEEQTRLFRTYEDD